MTYSAERIEEWARAAALFMERNGHTERANPVTVMEIVDVVGFKPCQWSRVKARLYALGYHPARKPGPGGGFYLGESGEEATGLVYEQKSVLTRLNNLEHLLKIVASQLHYSDVLNFADEKMEYDLRTFAAEIGSRAPQLALPAPMIFGRN